MNPLLSCLLQINENTQSELETKCTNTVSLSDDIQVMEGAVNGQHEAVWITTIMSHSSIHPTTSLCIQTGCTWSALWKSLMVGHGNRGDRTGYGKVWKLGYINQKLVCGSTCSELPAKSAGMSLCYVIHRSENICFSWLENDMPQSFCMQLSIDRNCTLAVNTDYMIICTKLLSIKQQLGHGYGECEWSVNDSWFCK